ncbi:MAG: type II secretion system F family protein [Patescibacteria group bacterium]|nr:type II secretion system F family protein [Patescibacteria group bacterium]
MPTFDYRARDKEGKVITGTVEAGNENIAASVISQRGWIPTLILQKGSRSGFLGPVRLFGSGISSTKRTVFTRQLATMVNAGLPLTQSLEILYKQSAGTRLGEVVEQIFHDVEAGSTLNQSMAKYPEVFSRVYVNLVKAGEASGSLDKVLNRLAENEEKMNEFTGKVKGAFVYPVIVLFVMAVVFVVMMVFVVPKLVLMYRDLGTALPLPTKILIWISDLFTKRFYLPLGFVIAAVIGYRYFSQSDYGIRETSRLAFKIPIFGNLKKQSELTEFARTLSLLVSAGIPILDALSIVSEAINDPVYREALKEASAQVERGAPLSNYLKANDNFPPLLSQMIAVGEETGKLDEVLLKVSSFFENETENALKALTVALEPAIMIVLGILVALLVISIIMPIYQLTSAF